MAGIGYTYISIFKIKFLSHSASLPATVKSDSILMRYTCRFLETHKNSSFFSKNHPEKSTLMRYTCDLLQISLT